MTEYSVTWSIDLDEESPEEAAEQALAMLQDLHSIATIFVVETDHEKWVIDVEVPGEPVLIRHEINGEKVR